jgi:uncharacterized protein YukE
MAIMNFNYNKAIKQAEKIESVADDMQNIANRQFQTAINSISVCWKGDASAAFNRYCVATQTDMRAQSSKLLDLGKRIREVAKILKEAEEKALELQRQRSSSAGSIAPLNKQPSAGYIAPLKKK